MFPVLYEQLIGASFSPLKISMTLIAFKHDFVDQLFLTHLLNIFTLFVKVGGQERDKRGEVGRRNMMPIPNTAAASLRYNVSPSATAALVDEFLQDLIKSGVFTPEHSYLALDKSKVQRARQGVMARAREEGDSECSLGEVEGIYFDGRKDQTKTLEEDPVTGRYHPKLVKESHITVTSEPKGSYMFHFTPEKSIPPNKPAYMEALALVTWMEQQGLDKTVKVLGGDSTNPNTGWAGGAMTWVERLLNRKVFWMICAIHTNELPLRHLIERLIGKTKGKDKFNGPIGEKLYVVNQLERNYSFKPIPGLSELQTIPPQVVAEMSNDSSLFYRLGMAIRTGQLPAELATRKCGTLVHSRWLTTGTAILLLYVSHHGLEEEEELKLELLAKFTLQVYHHMYWEIKVKHSIVEAPRHVLTQLSLLRKQDPSVQEIVAPYVRSGAWFAHSEAIILSLISSQDKKEREFGVQMIIKRRGNSEFGDNAVRARRTPDINLQASSLTTLISWETDIHEPVFTVKLSKAEVQSLVESPFCPPYFPCHTQSTERAVRQVTEAADSVVGFQARHGFVLARQASRAALPRFGTKQDIMKMFCD